MTSQNLARLVAGQHDEVPPLGLAGTRSPRREVDEIVEQLRRDRIGAGTPGSSAAGGRLRPNASAQVRAPSLTRSSAIVQP